MLAKYWKKIVMLILIVSCVFNIMGKLFSKLSLNKEMLYSAVYMQEHPGTNTTQNNITSNSISNETTKSK